MPTIQKGELYMRTRACGCWRHSSPGAVVPLSNSDLGRGNFSTTQGRFTGALTVGGQIVSRIDVDAARARPPGRCPACVYDGSSTPSQTMLNAAHVRHLSASLEVSAPRWSGPVRARLLQLNTREGTPCI